MNWEREDHHVCSVFPVLRVIQSIHAVCQEAWCMHVEVLGFCFLTSADMYSCVVAVATITAFDSIRTVE